MTTKGKFAARSAVIEAEQFIPGQPMPAGFHPWPDEHGSQPRDMSFGYVDTPVGRAHVMAGGYWIVTGANGERWLWNPIDFENTFVRVADGGE